MAIAAEALEAGAGAEGAGAAAGAGEGAGAGSGRTGAGALRKLIAGQSGKMSGPEADWLSKNKHHARKALQTRQVPKEVADAEAREAAAEQRAKDAERQQKGSSPATRSPTSSKQQRAPARGGSGRAPAARSIPMPRAPRSVSAAGKVGRGFLAIIAGALTLEILSYVTGQYVSIDWQGFGNNPLGQQYQTMAYKPLVSQGSGGGGAAQQLGAVATGQTPATIAQQNAAAQITHAGGT